MRAKSARAFARDLRAGGDFRYAEPDVAVASASRAPAFAAGLPADPLTGAQWWRAQVIQAGMTPPAVHAKTPWLAVIDSQLDTTHPEASAGNLVAATSGTVADEHGTAVASVAAAPANGVGIVGLWPGLPTRVYDSGDTCGPVARTIDRASEDGAGVINMSFGFSFPCYTLYVAVTGAAGSTVMVAAGGNEFDEGNRPSFPASWPHVLTVSAVDPQLRSSYFSNENEGIDIAAPGEQVLAATPLAYDADGVADGYAMMAGTSFSAPLVAAAATWVSAMRPRLNPDQVSWALTDVARDLGRRGWDQAYGWGLLQVSSPLRSVVPPFDFAEPNDDMLFINGRVFRGRDAPALRLTARRRDRLFGHLDDWEDPDDVYWLAVPRRSKFDITLRVRRGDADLYAYRRNVPSIFSGSGSYRRRGLIDVSSRSGRATEVLRLQNPGPATLIAVAVRIYPPHPSLVVDYTLGARRFAR